MAPLFPRSGPGESGSPTSAVILRCYDFPTRIPGHLFVSLPGSTLSFSVRVSQLPLALPEGRREPSGPGQLCNRRPQVSACSRVGVSGSSQVPRRSILCLCLELRPRPNRRSLAIGGFVDAAPASSPAKASAREPYRGYRAALAPAAYASRMVLPPSMQSSLPAGWLAFTGRVSNPLDREERFQISFSSSFPGLFLTQRRSVPAPASLLSCRPDPARSGCPAASVCRWPSV